MNKRVLITGASGFIGSGILKYALEHTTWDFVCVCSWRHKGTPANLQFVKDNPRVTIISHDLTGTMPDLGHFDYILNLASESHVDRSISDPLNFVENNVSSVLQVLEYARKYTPEMFIQFSTDEVYGANDHAEWDIYQPTNPYAASKAAQEVIAQAYGMTYGLPIVITNSNNIIGQNQDKEKFVPKVIDIIKNNGTVQIHTVNGKPGSRHWNPVENVADALLFLLANVKLDTTRPVPHFSLPGGKNLDNLEMAQLIAHLMGNPLAHELQDAREVRPAYDEHYPHTDGKITEMGWLPPLTLEEGLLWIKPM
jgi:dTDP-glucose 4,6-dehydratase